METQDSKIIEWLVEKLGIVKTEKQAYVLITIFVVVAILGALIFSGIYFSKNSTIKGTEYQPTEGYGGKILPDNYR